MRIEQHTELDVYKKAFDAAMLILKPLRSFRKKRPIRSATKFVDLRGQYVPISPKLGANAAIRPPLLRSFRMPKVKRRKPGSGLSLR
jgi:hypothetical protein